MANAFQQKIKKIWRYVWELWKSSMLPAVMYGCASMILMMLVMKNMERGSYTWGSKQITWTVVCVLGAAAYQALYAWAKGGTQYEMLVSGNVRRMSVDAYGNEYKMSSYKAIKEYRPWKGFVGGAFVAILPIVLALIFGLNAEKINAVENSKGMGALLLFACFFSGWTIIPFYCMNYAGISVSYFLSIFLTLIPIVAQGGMYIGGAYSKRNKAIRLQMLEDKSAAEEEARRANAKVNYGGLAGTKPRKRR